MLSRNYALNGLRKAVLQMCFWDIGDHRPNKRCQPVKHYSDNLATEAWTSELRRTRVIWTGTGPLVDVKIMGV
jgi:hypothetical protein